MKTLSPWFQTAQLLKGIRQAISAVETERGGVRRSSGGHRQSDVRLRGASRAGS